jgi:hypothetical protein
LFFSLYGAQFGDFLAPVIVLEASFTEPTLVLGSKIDPAPASGPFLNIQPATILLN